MGEIFLRLFNMSLNASWLVLAVLALRFVFKKAPKWVNCILWGLVALRLVMPFSVESMFSLIPNANPVPTDIALSAQPAVDLGIPVLNELLNGVIYKLFAPTGFDSINPLQIVLLIAGMVWMLGMGTMLIYSMFTYILLRHQVRDGECIDGCVYQSQAVDTPFILGFFAPRIYVPADIDPVHLEYVLRHERAHLKRRDHWWKPLAFVLLSVYWFNPLMWVAYTLLCRDIELACDEKVVSPMSVAEKKGYSIALLECSIHRRKIMSCPLAFGEIGVKQRVKSVLSYKKPALWIVLGSVITTAVLAVCFLTNPQLTKSISLDRVCSASLCAAENNAQTLNVGNMQLLGDFDRFEFRPEQGSDNAPWQYKLQLRWENSGRPCTVEFREDSMSVDGTRYVATGKTDYKQVLSWIKGVYDALDKPTAHQHQWSGWQTTEEAGCGIAGSQCRSCDCGEKQTQTIPALDHQPGDWIVEIPAAVGSEGWKYVSCLRCGLELERQTIAALTPEHSHQAVGWRVTQAPTCTETGTQQLLCGCGMVMKTETVPTAAHVAVRFEVARPSTCSEKGVKNLICACGAIVGTEQIPTIGHTPVEQVTVSPPTCTENGVIHILCACGAVMSKDYPFATGHIRDFQILKQPTCTEDGQTQDYCTVCKQVISTGKLSALGHVVVTTGQVKATCTESGWTGESICKYCDEVTQKQTFVPALGHAMTTLPSVEPTCISEGKTEGEQCVRCQLVQTEQTVLPKLDHSFIDGLCYCGEQENMRLQYKIENDHCVITGIGSCTDTTVVIPERVEGMIVTAIAEDAFRGVTFMESCQIPNTVEFIGRYAFAGCTALKSIDLPDKLRSVEWGTFAGCTALESVKMDAGWRICESAFSGCTALRSVSLSAGLREIHADAFRDCSGLWDIWLPGSLQTLSAGAFRGCTYLSFHYYGHLSDFCTVTRYKGWNEGCVSRSVSCYDGTINCDNNKITWYS